MSNVTKKKIPKVTSHAKKRIKQRYREELLEDELVLFKRAKKNGYTTGDFTGTDFYDYLHGKLRSNNVRLRVYKGYIFLYNKVSRRLFTMYAVPRKYLKYVELRDKKDMEKV